MEDATSAKLSQDHAHARLLMATITNGMTPVMRSLIAHAPRYEEQAKTISELIVTLTLHNTVSYMFYKR